MTAFCVSHCKNSLSAPHSQKRITLYEEANGKDERRIVLKQKGNKKFDLYIYIGIFLFCTFLIYQMFMHAHR
jgi:hypothetical protein